jgi:hypothetical protein
MKITQLGDAHEVVLLAANWLSGAIGDVDDFDPTEYVTLMGRQRRSRLGQSQEARVSSRHDLSRSVGG